MRKTARVDANQAAIVEALRAIGASVQSLAMVGRGVPDLLVGFRSQNWLIEVKDGAKPESARRLTADEVAWHDGWRGQVATVTSIEDALELVSSGIINR
jgi:hypothetical protein